jgi:hypothetical protein
MRLRRSIPSESSSGCLFDNIAAASAEIIPENDVRSREHSRAIVEIIPDNTVEYNQCILTISLRNDLSTLSLAVGTRLGWRRSDTGSNSSS